MDGLFDRFNVTEDQNIPNNLIEISSLIKVRTKTTKANLIKLANHEFNENSETYKIISYALMSENTYYRSFFVEILGKALNVPTGKRRFIGTLLEILHCSINIINDFPEIDNNYYRNNNLSCHLKYDKTQTIIASNLMNAWVFNLITGYKDVKLTKSERCDIANIISKNIGNTGNIGNQMMKVILKKKGYAYKDEITRIKKIHYLSLFSAGGQCIELLANTTKQQNDNIKIYINNLISLFEIYDNLTDCLNTDRLILENAKLIAEQSKKAISSISDNNVIYQNMYDFIDYNFYNIEKVYKSNINQTSSKNLLTI